MKKDKIIECRKCVNANANPSLTFDKSGLCNVCALYGEYFDKNLLKKELGFVKSFIGKKNGEGFDAMVGISGGKDSTATLYTIKQMGFTPLAFTLDLGYYPPTIFSRSVGVAKQLGVAHAIVDARKYIRPVDLKCYEKTAKFYDEPEGPELAAEFKRLYEEGRGHYSVKCRHAMPFVRTCQLCRRTVVRAYYAEAVARGVSLVVLGINEWAHLSKVENGKKPVFSAIRKLKPYKNKSSCALVLPPQLGGENEFSPRSSYVGNKPAVYVIHLPFLLQRTLRDTKAILKKLGWREPVGESLVESNSNSCLFGLAAEEKAKRMLGFHPDATRLAREVTVGFLSKAEAKKSLAKVHKSDFSVREVLRRAGLTW